MNEKEFYIANNTHGVDGMTGHTYYFTGNFGDSYPPLWSWRQDLAIKVRRKEVADSFADHVSNLSGYACWAEPV
jgi:hypothetical protein